MTEIEVVMSIRPLDMIFLIMLEVVRFNVFI